MFTIKTLDEAENFVASQKQLGNDVEFEGWDIVFYRPAAQGFFSKNGAFRKSQWCFKNISALEGDGTWLIDPRNVKRSRS